MLTFICSAEERTSDFKTGHCSEDTVPTELMLQTGISRSRQATMLMRRLPSTANPQKNILHAKEYCASKWKKGAMNLRERMMNV